MLFQCYLHEIEMINIFLSFIAKQLIQWFEEISNIFVEPSSIQILKYSLNPTILRKDLRVVREDIYIYCNEQLKRWYQEEMTVNFDLLPDQCQLCRTVLSYSTPTDWWFNDLISTFNLIWSVFSVYISTLYVKNRNIFKTEKFQQQKCSL